ncbi:hypothetical protein SNEBB_007452 [Seison nebaliae]|nr:hypothetical protein SNEBB_007452 [Seison nebaliae]
MSSGILKEIQTLIVRNERLEADNGRLEGECERLRNRVESLEQTVSNLRTNTDNYSELKLKIESMKKYLSFVTNDMSRMLMTIGRTFPEKREHSPKEEFLNFPTVNASPTLEVKRENEIIQKENRQNGKEEICMKVEEKVIDERKERSFRRSSDQDGDHSNPSKEERHYDCGRFDRNHHHYHHHHNEGRSHREKDRRHRAENSEQRRIEKEHRHRREKEEHSRKDDHRHPLERDHRHRHDKLVNDDRHHKEEDIRRKGDEHHQDAIRYRKEDRYRKREDRHRKKENEKKELKKEENEKKEESEKEEGEISDTVEWNEIQYLHLKDDDESSLKNKHDNNYSHNRHHFTTYNNHRRYHYSERSYRSTDRSPHKPPDDNCKKRKLTSPRDELSSSTMTRIMTKQSQRDIQFERICPNEQKKIKLKENSDEEKRRTLKCVERTKISGEKSNEIKKINPDNNLENNSDNNLINFSSPEIGEITSNVDEELSDADDLEWLNDDQENKENIFDSDDKEEIEELEQRKKWRLDDFIVVPTESVTLEMCNITVTKPSLNDLFDDLSTTINMTECEEKVENQKTDFHDILRNRINN